MQPRGRLWYDLKVHSGEDGEDDDDDDDDVDDDDDDDVSMLVCMFTCGDGGKLDSCS